MGGCRLLTTWSLLALLTIFPSGEACTLNLQAKDTKSSQNAQVGSGTCTWTIVTGDTNTIISVNIRNITLTRHSSCDVSNSISLRDGDSSGPIIGIACGDDADRAVSVVSSGNTITLQYPASEVTSTDAFVVEYQAINSSKCGDNELTARSTTEYTLQSPGYPTGVPWAKTTCVWIIAPENGKRIRFTFEAAAGTSPPCDQLSVGLYKVPRLPKLGSWCQGNTSFFQTYNDVTTLVAMFVGEGQALKVTYRAIEASTCGGNLTATAADQDITSTNFPNPYPSFEECRWFIYSGTNPVGKALRIQIIASDMEETEGCVTDSVKLYISRYIHVNSHDRLAGTSCGEQTPTYILYKKSVLVVFKSIAQNTANKGVKIRFRRDEGESCQSTLVANSTSQILMSPGYPFSYPTNTFCRWVIRASDPEKTVQISFLDTQIFPHSVSTDCYDERSIKVYDGTDLNRNYFQIVCGRSTPNITGLDQSMVIVFQPDMSEDGGFKLEYKQVEVTEGMPSQRQLIAKRRESALLSSPRYPDGKVRNMDVSWTIRSPRFYTNTFLIMFDDVTVGDGSSCDSNYIAVYDGNITDNDNLLYKVCKNEKVALLSKTPTMTIVYRTDGTLAKKGFVANYTSGNYGGCIGEDVITDNFLSMSYLESPNYPYLYPINMDCTNHLKSRWTEDYYIHIKSLDMDIADNTCQKDYVEIFDGPSSSSPSLGKFCGQQEIDVKSSGVEVTVKFISDGEGGGKGCRLSYEPVYTGGNGLAIGLAAGFGTAAGIMLIGVTAYCVHRYKQKRVSSRLE